MKLSQNSIQAALKNLDDKVKTLEGQAKDLKSQKKVNSQKSAAEQAWAGNSYDLAVQSGNVSVDNARAEVQIAQQRLDEFYREKEAKTSGDDLSGFTDGEEGFNDGETTVTQEDDSATETALQDDLRARQEALNEVIAGRNQTLASAGKRCPMPVRRRLQTVPWRTYKENWKMPEQIWKRLQCFKVQRE